MAVRANAAASTGSRTMCSPLLPSSSEALLQADCALSAAPASQKIVTGGGISSDLSRGVYRSSTASIDAVPAPDARAVPLAHAVGACAPVAVPRHVASSGHAASVSSRAHAPAMLALSVTPGHERAMQRRIARLAGDALADCFTLTVELQRRRQRVWCTEYEPLFPGYLFLQAADLARFEQLLALSSTYARLVRLGHNAATLTPQEAEFVCGIGGAGHLIGMSEGVVEQGRLRVYAGPLTGREHLVKNFNRHKRMAYLNTGFRAAGVTRVGLEVPMKV